jgi:hypothetical protein
MGHISNSNNNRRSIKMLQYIQVWVRRSQYRNLRSSQWDGGKPENVGIMEFRRGKYLREQSIVYRGLPSIIE